MNWIVFGVLGVLTYAAFSLVAQLTGGAAHSAVGAAFSFFKPYALVTLVVANLFWAMAVYFGLRESRDALPMLVAIGVIVSFVYSILFLHDQATPARLLGLVLVLGGIYLLA